MTDYVLVCVTHGDHAATLATTITSFEQHVTPSPVARLLVTDGPDRVPVEQWEGQRLTTGRKPRGFCEAVRAGWEGAIALADWVGAPYVFWLEHDFRFLRPVNLDHAAALLHRPDDPIAQVSLLRGPANQEEEKAGGLAALYGRRFVRRMTVMPGGHAFEWIRHDAYFTTNPSLMRTRMMSLNPWPTGPACEGKQGAALRKDGYAFAALGNGDPWVDHFGTRDGHGY